MESNPTPYYWRATYADGSRLSQFENGEEQLFGAVDHERLVDMSWVPHEPSKPTYTLKLAPWQRLILLRRHQVSGGVDAVLFILGWQATINGRNYRSVILIHPDGSVEMTEEL